MEFEVFGTAVGSIITEMFVLISPRDVANYLLSECRRRGELLTNLKLQKLMYYAQARLLALHGRQLFEEDCEAWGHGPVIDSQYRRFSKYQSRPIKEAVSCPALPANVQAHLNEVINLYGALSDDALGRMIQTEVPWKEARGDLPPNVQCNNPISKYTMRGSHRATKVI